MDVKQRNLMEAALITLGYIIMKNGYEDWPIVLNLSHALKDAGSDSIYLDGIIAKCSSENEVKVEGLNDGLFAHEDH